MNTFHAIPNTQCTTYLFLPYKIESHYIKEFSHMRKVTISFKRICNDSSQNFQQDKDTPQQLVL